MLLVCLMAGPSYCRRHCAKHTYLNANADSVYTASSMQSVHMLVDCSLVGRCGFACISSTSMSSGKLRCTCTAMSCTSKYCSNDHVQTAHTLRLDHVSMPVWAKPLQAISARSNHSTEGIKTTPHAFAPTLLIWPATHHEHAGDFLHQTPPQQGPSGWVGTCVFIHSIIQPLIQLAMRSSTHPVSHVTKHSHIQFDHCDSALQAMPMLVFSRG